MKATKFLIAILLFSFAILQSCADDPADPNAYLTGKFTISAVTVDGVASVGSGTINFVNADKSGDLDITYRVDITDVTLSGDFIYTATSDLLTLNPGTANETIWTRITDEEKTQVVKFTQAIGGKTRIINITFKK
jgi:hypothetical protein